MPDDAAARERGLRPRDYLVTGFHLAAGAFFAVTTLGEGSLLAPAAGVLFGAFGLLGSLASAYERPRAGHRLAAAALFAGAWAALVAGFTRFIVETSAPTALAAGAIVAGASAYRRHGRLFEVEGRARGAGAAFVGVLYGALGWGAWHLVHTVMDAPNLDALGVAVYALGGVKLVLDYAASSTARDASPQDARTFPAWVRANALAIGTVLVVLALYAATRSTFAARVPYFPLIEFMLGVALFGFALSWLRTRVKKHVTDAPVASPHHPHTPHLQVSNDAEYDAVRRPVETFLETGSGLPEYRHAVARAAHLPDAEAVRVLAPVAAYRRPVRAPPLPFAWTVVAALVVTAGTAAAIAFLLRELMNFPRAFAGPVMLLVAGLGIYRLQSDLRQRARPWEAVGVAVAGVGVALGGFIALVQRVAGDLAAARPSTWGIPGALALGLIAAAVFSALRMHRDLTRGDAPAPVNAPTREEAFGQAHALSKGRLPVLVTLFVILVLVMPPFLTWFSDAARVGNTPIMPSGFPAFYAALVPGLGALFSTRAVAHAIRLLGLTRAREAVIAADEAERAERLRLHRAVMTGLDAPVPVRATGPAAVSQPSRPAPRVR